MVLTKICDLGFFWQFFHGSTWSHSRKIDLETRHMHLMPNKWQHLNIEDLRYAMSFSFRERGKVDLYLLQINNHIPLHWYSSSQCLKINYKLKSKLGHNLLRSKWSVTSISYLPSKNLVVQCSLSLRGFVVRLFLCCAIPWIGYLILNRGNCHSRANAFSERGKTLPGRSSLYLAI